MGRRRSGSPILPRMSSDIDKLERIEKVRARLKMERGWQYLSEDDLGLIEEVLKKESSRLSKANDFRIEAKRRRESLQPPTRLGALRPMRNLSRTEGRRDPDELPGEVRI